MVWGKFRIRDFHDYGAQLTVADVIVKSSNIGTAHIAQLIGAERQQDVPATARLSRRDPGRTGRGAAGPPLLPAKLDRDLDA